jgi:hypothetical protein
MSDLSKVLGDLYDAPAPAAPSAAEARFQPTAPEWADEDRLDEAFEGWTPGPPADAPAAEREMSEMSVVMDTPFVPAARLDDELSATLSEALVDAGRDNHQPDVPVASAPTYELPGYDFEPAPVAEAAPVYEYEPPVVEAFAPVEPAHPWTRGDDDILPGKHHHVAKAPKVKGKKVKEPKAAKADKSEGAPKKFFGLQLRK